MQSHHDAGEVDHARIGLMRGILVIVTAVAVGAFVLARVDLDEGGAVDAALAGSESAADQATDEAEPAASLQPEAASEAVTTTMVVEPTTTTAAPETTASTEDDSPTTPAGPAIAAPADTRVLVLNAEGTKGVAGRGTEQLRDAGFDVLAPRNATALSPTSAVLYLDDFQSEAESVAEVFGQGPDLVSPLDPGNPPFDDLGDAMVVVLIGQDEALGL